MKIQDMARKTLHVLQSIVLISALFLSVSLGVGLSELKETLTYILGGC